MQHCLAGRVSVSVGSGSTGDAIVRRHTNAQNSQNLIKETVFLAFHALEFTLEFHHEPVSYLPIKGTKGLSTYDDNKEFVRQVASKHCSLAIL